MNSEPFDNLLVFFITVEREAVIITSIKLTRRPYPTIANVEQTSGPDLVALSIRLSMQD